MTSHRTSRRDLTSLVIATLGTLFTVSSGPAAALDRDRAPIHASEDPALDSYIDIDVAKQQGAWWLDGDQVDARMSFAPQHDRLVWRVSSAGRSVLLDAETGEALEFEF